MKKILIDSLILTFLLSSCSTMKVINTPQEGTITGSEFFSVTEKMTHQQYDSTVVSCYEKGEIPRFMRYFKRINVKFNDSQGKVIKAHYFVAKDYISVGIDKDMMRTPLLPASAQKIANMTSCFLSTPKIADDVYISAKIKVEPIPMTCQREDNYTFYLHNMIINSQVKGRKALVSGDKKDVVLVSSLAKKEGKLALYGWHKKDGKPIQPVYTGHADFYVDYSHGYRLVYRTIWVNGKKMDYTDVLSHKEYYRAISNEVNTVFWAYPVECSCAVVR